VAVLPREGPTLWNFRELSFKDRRVRPHARQGKKLRRTSKVTGAGMPPGAQLCGPDAQLNGAQPVACRCACCGTLLRALRWYSICDCTRTPNQVAQWCAPAGVAMSGLPVHLLQLQDAPIWEIGTAGLTHYVNFWKVVPLPLARSERAGAL
jgi:hypothetical protein